MSRPQRRHPKTHVRSGFNALNGALQQVSEQAIWLDSMGEIGKVLQTWKKNLINDLGGEQNVSAMQLAVIELAAKTHLLLTSIDQFLLEQESLVNKSRRQVYPVVLQRQQVADSMSRYMGQLGLRREAKHPLSLEAYVAGKTRQRCTE